MKKPIILHNQADIGRQKKMSKATVCRRIHEGNAQPYKIKGRKTDFFIINELDF